MTWGRLAVTANPKRRRRNRRWLFWAILAAIPIAGVSAWIGLGVFASSALRQAEAEADRIDPGWRFDSLVSRRKVIPAAENSALRMARVLGTMRGNFPTYPKLVYVPGGMRTPPKDVLTRIEKITGGGAARRGHGRRDPPRPPAPRGGRG